MLDELEIIPVDLLASYSLQVDDDLQMKFAQLQDAELSTSEFS